MDVAVAEQDGESRVLELREGAALYRIRTTEHGLRDIEAELARRRAMSRPCPEVRDGHTCGLTPDHGTRHECRSCPEKWLA